MTLNENNSNKEPIADTMALQIELAMNICLPTIEYRKTVKLLNVAANSQTVEYRKQSNC